MDAFVLPSLTEGTPLALLEAMSHRLPVIASNVGGVPAIIDNGLNGLLTPPADPAALEERMATLAQDPALRDRLSEGGVQLVRRRFDVHGWTRKVRDLYMSTIQVAEAVS
jgi:glycosyltransferase involved in cell wall biosynthesis